MNLRRSLVAAAWLSFVVLMAGCSVGQELSVDADGAGRGELIVDLHPLFVNYYRDLVVGFGGSPDTPIFDARAIEAEFAARNAVDLLSVEIPRVGTLRLVFAFDDVEEAVRSLGRLHAAEAGQPGAAGDGPAVGAADGIVSFRKVGATRTLGFALDRAVVAVALGMAPVADAGSVGLLLPPEGSAMGADEYADYVAWALEEYAGDADAFEIIKGSAIELRVQVPGRVTAVRGGRETPGGARFEIPIVELLTLTEARRYEISFEVD